VVDAVVDVLVLSGGLGGGHAQHETGALWYTASMTTKTLRLAMEKAAALSEAAQEKIGREVLEYVDGMARLRAELEIGIRQLDAGMGEPLDIEEEILRARREYEG
jgi:hypothetical protein